MDASKKEVWETARGEVSLSLNDIKSLATGDPSIADAQKFLETCKAHRLNPYLDEAYLVEYKSRDGRSHTSITIGKDAFTQRAEAHLQFNGIEFGAIVQRGDVLEYLVGAFHMPSDVLLGGWARVHRKDWAKPLEASVSIAEYSSGQGMWRSKPATMIVKVALVHALRAAFPSSFVGLYDESEISEAIGNAPPPDTRKPAAAPPTEQPVKDAPPEEPEVPPSRLTPAKDVQPEAKPEWVAKLEPMLAAANTSMEYVQIALGADVTKAGIKAYMDANGLTNMGDFVAQVVADTDGGEPDDYSPPPEEPEEAVLHNEAGLPYRPTGNTPADGRKET